MADILDTLAKRGIIDKDDIAELEKEARALGVSVEELLKSKGINTESLEGSSIGVEAPEARAIVSRPGIPVREIDDDFLVPPEILNHIREESAEHYGFVPLAVKDGVLEVGIVDPDNIEARDALSFIAAKVSMPYKLFLVSEPDFKKVFAQYGSLKGEVKEALSQLGEAEAGPAKQSAPAGEDIFIEGEQEIDTRVIEDAPISKIVSTILRYATEGDASDVHVEPLRENVRVRFRVDGVLNTSLVLPLNTHGAVVARIKILSKMRLDEKRKPQDGRFSVKIEGRKIDYRVSTFPTYFGEKVVMRILDQEKGVRKLDAIGLSERNMEAIRRAISRPYGLVLISGPTGSGKTTTLYSILNEFDRDSLNVLSLEDPVEYNIEGVSQSQVRPDIGYTFANGLRTTLRQDPDVIMVGEIRDGETAALAVQAALTGHLVLATIHTNNAVGVIPRLIDMGVDPYLIAPTLILAMAQRLVSALCPGAGEPIPVEGKLKTDIEKSFADLPDEYRKDIKIGKEVYRATATSECPTGVRGRLSVMEVLEIDKEVEQVILGEPTEINISKVARAKGMLTMKEDAILKAFDKIIPFSEVTGL